MKWLGTVAALSLTVHARLPDGRPNGNFPHPPSVPLVEADPTPVVDLNGRTLPSLNTTYFFDQLIDHNNPGLGTFKQRFWHTWEWHEPGGPIILFTPGETNAERYSGFLTNKTINGQIAQQEHGATIVLEHRFYGESNPVPDLSAPNLKFHTIQQAIDDLEYFAKNVKLAMPGGDSVGPTQAPWILIGASYSGALTSWTMVNKPNLFRAGYASSGVVQAIVDFWQYFEPIRQSMPKNCSSDVQAVISHIDKVFTFGPKSEITKIKATFGLQNLTHLDDVAGALRNNLWDWQSLTPVTGYAKFFQFCDALEVKDGVSATASGWGVDHALSAWGKFWTSGYLADLCAGRDIESCLGTYDPKNEFFTDISLDNSWRSWEWIVCNEVGYYQDSPPLGWPSLVTRLAKPISDERQCMLFFPEAFKAPPVPAADRVNRLYKGWNVDVDRLFFANGQRDPWRDATLSADGMHFESTPHQPIALGNGFHCSDMASSNGDVEPSIKAVQVQALASMHEWLKGFVPATETKRMLRWERE